MRRWLALLAGVAVIALTGTALALSAPERVREEKVATETTVKHIETTTTTSAFEEPMKPEPVVSDVVSDVVEKTEAKEEVAREEPKQTEPVEPRDHMPFEVAILYPDDGQVFEKGEAVFEGSSAPGAKVFFGDRPADVKDNGSWRIVLDLKPGENHITASAIDESGNHATDSVTVIFKAPEPKKEEPKKEEPKKEEPKKEEPKAEEPHDVVWEFSAHQVYGECSETPPFDVFWGTGKPGSVIHVQSEYGSGNREVNQNGEWEIKVIFEGAPVGQTFAVKVTDEFDHQQVFEFTRVEGD
ncbi:MAG: hypothetical protein WBZ45_08540 [Acidimicrobiia bacterium]